MKFLVVILALALGYALWRHQRRSAPPPVQRRPSPPAEPQDMVACARCGVHVPRSEALALGTRHYCCAEHQRQDAH